MTDAKQKAKERDGWECQFCGMDNDTHIEKYDRGLHAHHIIKDCDGGSDHPSNYLTVCRTCHDTIENTQADALSRMKQKLLPEKEKKRQEEVERLSGELEEKSAEVNQLEARVEKMESYIERLEEQTSTPTKVFATFEETTLDIHVLVEGVFNPEVSIFNDSDEAAKAYSESDTKVRMFSHNVSWEETVLDGFRYASLGDVELHLDKYGEDYFGEMESATSGYTSADIPKELMADE